MDSILKEGYEKILRIFYNNKDNRIHLRDIARKTGLNENSVSRFLNQLVKLEILKYEKDGNLKKYFIKKNFLIFVIFSIFDIKRFESLASLRKRAFEYFFEKLEEQPIIVVLFGSSAKENYSDKSDIDLLLVVNKKIKTEKAEKNAETQTGLRINCLQISYEDFINEVILKQDKVVQSALNSGYPLTNHIKYYLEILK